MDLSIVIVNWKVKDLLRRCLASVYRETKGVSFEVFVADNDSRDGSLEMVLKEFPEATVIANNRNLGFAAGNNPALMRAEGEFVILLNPDTELKEDALTTMVAHMRANPRIGILGPRLVGADGKLQPSVRRFPTLVSQALIMLKLHHPLRKFGPLRRYFADDFDYTKAAEVDQVMGAAFMIRRKVLAQLGGLDERFFIWFEEVDYCKRAKDAGFEVWYSPVANVTHNGGESFGKAFGPTKQRYFNDSLRKYFHKHHGLLAAAAIAILDPLSMALAWLAQTVRDARATPDAGAGSRVPARDDKNNVTPHLMRGPEEKNDHGSSFFGGDFYKTYRMALLLFLLFECVSISAYLLPVTESVIYLTVLGTVAVIALFRPDLAMLVLLAELFIGSQGGYLIVFGAEQGLYLSLRHGLFLLIVAVWFAELLASTFAGGDRRKQAWEWFRLMGKRGILVPYALMLCIIVFGVVRGVLLGNRFNNVFFDVDRYFYFGLFPALVAAFASPSLRRRAVPVLAAAITSAVLKALAILFFFSHRMFVVASNVYVWVRDTRVGEITIMVSDFYRIFFQSQVFILMTVFTAVLLFAYAASTKSPRARGAAAFVCWSMVSMILSLSRSFWFGGAVATLALAAVLVWGRAKAVIWRRLVVVGLGSVVAAVALIAIVYAFPYPNKSGQVSLTTLLGERAFSLGDAAANSRWALLPKLAEAAEKRPVFGSGFGTTVTYQTSDPRLLASSKTGEYTTYAFEWGYHDLWLKIGLLGLAVYGWFIVRALAPLF
ncbi:MAG TPA: glycosyltransferase family 2 protein, partial [Candidatus Eisenbacteria bacterium]|nr:glycosyltransferase family 2 protein [Candidatus Eisenbacteria bacterium]